MTKLINTDIVLIKTVGTNERKENLITTNLLNNITSSIIVLDPPSINSYIQPNYN